jgi:hypothetical protein
MQISNARFLAGITVCGMLSLSGCRPKPNPDGKIPFDPGQAREHIISGLQAQEYLNSFKTGDTALLHLLKDTTFLDKHFQLPTAESFNRDAIIALLDADSAAGVRIYLGRDAQGEVRFVLVPVDKNGQDIHTRLLPDSTTGGSGPQVRSLTVTSQAVEIGQRCPTQCDTTHLGGFN